MPLPADFSQPQPEVTPPMPEIKLENTPTAAATPDMMQQGISPTPNLSEVTPNVPLSTPDTLPSTPGMPTNEVTQMPPLPGSIGAPETTAVPEISTDAPLTESGDPSIQQPTPE